MISLESFGALSSEKVRRLRAIATAALEGTLDRGYLRSLPIADALTELCTLPGIGPFFAQGILFRGAGVVDDVTDEDVTKQAVQGAYHLPVLPSQEEVLARAEAWRPYRLWATVLLHVWLRREGGGPQRPPRQRRG